MNMEHVEVLERLRGVLEHGKMGDKCLIAPDLVAAAIASLSAPQPPAEAQPVATLVNRKDADGGKTTTFIRPAGLGMDLPIGEYPLHLHPPPSAPVGAEELVSRAISQGKRLQWSAVMDTLERLRGTLALAQQPAADAGQWVRCTPALLSSGVSCAKTPRRPGDGHSHDHFIAHTPQQPAAVDEAMVERAARAWCAGTDTPFDQLPDAGKARCLEDMRVVLTAALAAHQGGVK